MHIVAHAVVSATVQDPNGTMQAPGAPGVISAPVDQGGWQKQCWNNLGSQQQ